MERPAHHRDSSAAPSRTAADAPNEGYFDPQVRVNDPGQTLSKKSTDAAPPHVLVGAFDMRGGFHPATEVKKNGAGIDYEISIPLDTPTRLTVYSRAVKLEDDQHVPVASQGRSEVIVQRSSSQAPPKVYTFNATGRN